MRCFYKGYELFTQTTNYHNDDLFEFETGTCNGYIVIPEFEDIEYWEIPEGNIHGGWTFGADGVFGFDTLHSNSRKYMDEEWVIQHLKDYVDDILVSKR